jgi:glycosyltransferase involved in cell wall biosynthesis
LWQQKDEKMKITIISPAYPYRGGQALVEAYLHKTITDIGYQTNTISYSLLYPSIFFPGKTQFDDSKVIPFEHNDKIKRIINSINPFSWFKAYREIKKEKPDVVIIVWWMSFFAPALGTIAYLVHRKLKQTKVCFLVENYISHESRWFDKLFCKHTLRWADSFICESNYINKQISDNFPQKPIFETTLCVYDYYNLNKFDKVSAKEFLKIDTENVILFFGLIRPYKGLDKLIECFKDLIKSKSDTTLLIVGECYEDIQKYEKMIASYGIKDKTIMINRFVANEEIEPFFKASDMVVLPYYSATQSGILTMAYGFNVPVVVTNVGGMSELVKNNETGIIVENNEVENLLPAIERLLDTKNTIAYGQNIACLTHKMGYTNLNKILSEIR